MLNVKRDVNDAGWWLVAPGLRITPGHAFVLSGKGQPWTAILEIQVARGLAGLNPDTGAADFGNAPGLTTASRGPVDEARSAALFAQQADDRAGRIQEHLGVTDPLLAATVAQHMAVSTVRAAELLRSTEQVSGETNAKLAELSERFPV